MINLNDLLILKFIKKFSIFFITLLSFELSAQQAYFFQETFENTYQWPISNENQNVTLNNSSITLKNNGNEPSIFASSAQVLSDKDFKLEANFKESNNFELVFKPNIRSSFFYQSIAFQNNQIDLIRYDKKGKIISSSAIGSFENLLSIELSQINSIYKFKVNGLLYPINLSLSGGQKIAFKVPSSSSITLTKLNVKWGNKSIQSIELFNTEDESINKKRLSNQVNSPYHDIKPIVSSDGQKLYFTRKNDPNNEGKKTNDDIYLSTSNGKGWNRATRLSSELNTTNHNVLSTLFNNGDNHLVLDQYAGGKKIKDTYRTVEYKDGKWGKSTEIKFEDYENESSFISACISNDGNVLILSLKNKDGIGGNDLFVSIKNGKTWSKPTSIGTNINTNGDELSPFLSADNSKLYFSSNGWPGYGSNDIFVCKRQGSGWTNWSKPQNLGSKVNTPHWDAYFSITQDENLAFVSSSSGSQGGMDIFEFRGEVKNLNEPLLFKGYVYDSLTMEPLSNATVTLFDARSPLNKKVLSMSTDSTGYFETELPNKKIYNVLVEKRFYNGEKDLIDYKKITINTIKRNYYLNKYEPGQRIALEQIYFIQGQDRLRDISTPTVNKLYTIMRDNPTLRIMIEGHTDNQGDANKNQTLSEERTIRIKTFLIAKGIDESRMETVGYGQTRPFVENTSEFNMRLNRRVEFLIIK